MTLTLLLDLDDTLLDTHLADFVPAYFSALSKHLAAWVRPELLTDALVAGTRSMTENRDPTQRLQEVFEAVFYPRIGREKDEIAEALREFYERQFPMLRKLTAPRPEAQAFVAWARQRGHRLAIATDPLFPQAATHERIRWAGFRPEEFDLISTFEDFHFSKRQPAYFAELVGRLGCPDGPILMVGDDLERDILPAREVGLLTHYLDGHGPADDPRRIGPHGDLHSLQAWIQGGGPDRDAKPPTTRESVLSTMLATPAALLGMSRELRDADWRFVTAPDDWSLVELTCHLRDVEREIHRTQIDLFKSEREPFIPRPDAGVWARQRPYRTEDGAQALREFADARVATLRVLGEIAVDEWRRPARHAIFGPTTFLEVISFMAEHDRLHIQQAWKILRAQAPT
jgi:FMN phosphatase YigB (HAD superfamily)